MNATDTALRGLTSSFLANEINDTKLFLLSLGLIRADKISAVSLSLPPINTVRQTKKTANILRSTPKLL